MNGQWMGRSDLRLMLQTGAMTAFWAVPSMNGSRMASAVAFRSANSAPEMAVDLGSGNALAPPGRDIRTGLLYDLIGARQERRRKGQSNRLCGFQVDGQLECRRLFHRQVRGLCTP